MAINITVTGLTQQQSLDVANAFDAIPGRGDAGMTKAQWVERQIIIFIKNAVKGSKRNTYDSQFATDSAQIDTDYQ